MRFRIFNLLNLKYILNISNFLGQLMSKRIKVVFVTGPTATGKTSLAVDLARSFDGEIISVDSRQVYRGMDIGSGKDLADYEEGGAPVRHHLIDIVDPTDEYNLMSFCRDAKEAVIDIHARGKLPIFCGGTALYLNALISGHTLPGSAPDSELRKELRAKSTEELAELLKEKDSAAYESLKDKDNHVRLIRAIENIEGADHQVEPLAPLIEPLVIGVYFLRKEVHKRIEARLGARLESGMIEEVENLHKNGVSWEKLEFFGLEYRFVALYLQGKMPYEEMKEKLLFKIRKFAKSQDIWFRKIEREGTVIHWLEKGDRDEAETLLRGFLDGKRLPEPQIRLKDIHYGPTSS
jgi:tRNA dimethylallyltransferase